MALEDRSVTATPEGVSVDVVLAGLGSRFAAYALDVTIQLAAFLVVAAATGAVTSGGGQGAQLAGVGFLAAFALCDFIGYFVVCELVWNGRSVGKRAAGTRVVREGGGPVGFWSSLLRNLLRLIDWLPAFYLVGSVSIGASTSNQRLGDFAGNTVVVRERVAAERALAQVPWSAGPIWAAPVGSATAWVPTPSPTPWLPPELAHWDVSAVDQRDLALVRLFLTNRAGYEPVARQRLACDLANRIWPHVAGPAAPPPPEQFLEAVALVKSARG